jgi:hypothetical protein
MRIWVLFFLLPSLLLGCSTFGKSNRVKIAERAKTELIGTPKQELFACAGAPTRSITIDEMEFIVYVSDDACEVTFVLNNGIVDKVSYASRKRGMPAEMERCAPILEKCLSDR